MENEPRTASRFVPDRLPWIVAGVALAIYVLTLNRWVRIESVTTVAKMTGWDMAPLVYAPLLYLFSAPVRWLPGGIQPVALNVLTALFAALTLGLLARSVALLPFDRSREGRMRGREESPTWTLRSAWRPVVLAVVLCGLQLSYWEHATAATGEMLDLLLFAFLVHALLAYRIDGREGRLLVFAAVYGVATAQNFAMIAFFPCFLVAVIRLKRWEFLRLAFLGQMLAAGVAGLLLYLFLPLVALMGGDSPLTFWQHLRAQWASQRAALATVPPYVILLVSFTSLLPVLLISVRWSSSRREFGAPGDRVTTVLLWAVQAVLLVACTSVFFDPTWSPRLLGFGFGYGLLPFYYLAALSVGYFVGYFLMLFEGMGGRGASGTGDLMQRLRPVWTGVVLAAALGAAVVLVGRNHAKLRVTDGRLLAGLADRMIASLPAEGPAYVVGDIPLDLMLVEGRLRAHRTAPPVVLVHSRSLEFVRYHQSLLHRYPQRWPELKDLKELAQPIEGKLINDLLVGLARSNRVCYLNPSFGRFFESLRLVPRGLAYDVRPLDPTALQPPALTAADLGPARQFWEGAAAYLRQLPATTNANVFEPWYVAQFYSRALNHWGVTLQRSGDTAGAEKWFQLALEINPYNAAARTNLSFNARLQRAGAAGIDLAKAPDLPSGYQTIDALLLANGPLDDPQWVMAVGQAYSQSSLYVQALVEFSRAVALVPGDTTALVWRQNSEIMTRFSRGDLDGAEKEALALLAQFPEEKSAGEALAQIYLASGRLTNALAAVERQLRLDPENQRALLNKSALCIQLSRFEDAIPPLDRLLEQQPGHAGALLNRAIAHLQSGHLDPARRDYEALAKIMPESTPIDYGLAEIAYRRQDIRGAIAHYEAYLKHSSEGAKGSEEYKRVRQRLEALQRGEKPQ